MRSWARSPRRSNTPSCFTRNVYVVQQGAPQNGNKHSELVRHRPWLARPTLSVPSANYLGSPTRRTRPAMIPTSPPARLSYKPAVRGTLSASAIAISLPDVLPCSSTLQSFRPLPVHRCTHHHLHSHPRTHLASKWYCIFLPSPRLTLYTIL